MTQDSLQIIRQLRAKSPNERRKILLTLTKRDKQALFDHVYFERGTELNVSLYDGYDERNSGVDRLRCPEYSLAYVFIKNFNALKVLEVGCATGWFVKVLTDYGIEAYGVDISSYAISKADISVKGFLRNVDIDTERLPFEDGFFDVVVSFETLEHLANVTYALKQLNRVLKAGGSLFITVPKPSPNMLNDVTHVNLWTEGRWIETLSNSGFSYTPFSFDHPEILKAHVDLLTKLDFGNSVKWVLIKPLRRNRLGKSILYAYLLIRRRLREALRVLTDSHHVFSFERE